MEEQNSKYCILAKYLAHRCTIYKLIYIQLINIQFIYLFGQDVQKCDFRQKYFHSSLQQYKYFLFCLINNSKITNPCCESTFFLCLTPNILWWCRIGHNELRSLWLMGSIFTRRTFISIFYSKTAGCCELYFEFKCISDSIQPLLNFIYLKVLKVICNFLEDLISFEGIVGRWWDWPLNYSQGLHFQVEKSTGFGLCYGSGIRAWTDSCMYHHHLSFYICDFI